MAGWFDIGQEAEGVIAIGQIATGVIAIGQMATGVIAIGQVARGFVAVGQGAIGLFAVGMGAVGVFHATAMMGIAGRGIGFVLPVAPFWPKRYEIPEPTPWSALESGADDDGWLEVTLDDDDHGPRLLHDGQPLPVRFDRERWLRARHAVRPGAIRAHGPRRLFAHLQRRDGELLCTDLRAVPPRAHRGRGFWVALLFQMTGMTAVAIAFWLLAGLPVLQALRG